MDSSGTKHADASSGKEHVSRAKDPVIVRGRQSPIAWMASIPAYVGMLIVFLVVVFWLKGCGDRAETKRATRAAQHAAAVAQPQAPEPVEAYNGTREFRFDPSNTEWCLEGWIDDPYIYLFGDDRRSLIVRDRDGGASFLITSQGWSEGRRPLRAANMSFCQAYPGSADSVHVRGRWKNN